MNFLYPYFLIALISIAIPIIIHLFNFRTYKVVYFSNVDFLKNIKQETKAKSQLKHLLILLARILAIICLVFAFSQPYIPVNEEVKKTKEEIISVYIDNSFSMEAEGKSGKLLELAKNKAFSIANAYPNRTKFLLLSNDFLLKNQHLVSKEQFINSVKEIKTSPVVRDLSTIISRSQDFFKQKNENDKEFSVFILSDFQKTSNDFSSIKNNHSIIVNLVPLANQINNNLYIDTCWFETPNRKLNQTEELFVKIINNSDEEYQNIPVKLNLSNLKNKKLVGKALSSFNIKSNSFTIVKLTYTNTQTGILNGKISISDYPIVYDNDFYFSYQIAENVNILNVFEEKENQYINALFGKDDYFLIEQNAVSKIKVSNFSKFQLIILDELKNISSGLTQDIINYIASGGTVLFFPNDEGSIKDYNYLLSNLQSNTIINLDTSKTKIDKINYENQLYKNVFKKIEDNTNLPTIFKHFVFNKQTKSNVEMLLGSQNGHEILTVTYMGKGSIYISAIPNNTKSSNLVKHPIFVPTLYNIALNSEISSKIYHTIGKDNHVFIQKDYLSENYDVFHISNLNGENDFIPENDPNILDMNVKLLVSDKIKKADNYLVKTNNQIIESVAFNYDRKESNLNYFSVNEIQKQLDELGFNNFKFLEAEDEKQFASVLKDISTGKQLWKTFIIFSLIFFASEILLIRLWK